MIKEDISREAAAALVQSMTEDEKLGLLTTHQHPVERLGLGEFYIGTEVARGYVGRDDAHYSTVFPQPIGLAATFDRSLMKQLGSVAGNECRAYYNKDHKNALCVWGPTVDMERDPRWGRTEEAYGEDVCLAGEMTAAYTRGLAGDDSVYLKTLPTLKHFCANNVEESRMDGDSQLPPRLKYEYYYAAFMPAIRYGGARSVMTAYNEINGVPALCNPELRTILKEQWGLWFAVTDGGDFSQTVLAHQYCDSHAEAYAEALKAGCDIMTDSDTLTRRAAEDALERGLITMDDIDRMLTDVIYARMRLGQLSEDCPYDCLNESCIDSEQAKEVNARAAVEQLVLLKNDGLLPLDPQQTKRIAVLGPLADENLMDWYTGRFRDAVSPVEGIANEFAESETVTDSLWNLVAVQAANGLYLSAHSDGSCVFDSPRISDENLFELQQWGENWNNLYSRKYKKYVRMSDQGMLRLHSRRIYDWFTQETFCLLETPDGMLFEEPLLGRRMQADLASGSVSFVKQNNVALRSLFRIEIVSSGRERAETLAADCDAVIYCTGNHPVQVAKECYDRKTLALNIQPDMSAFLHKINPRTVLMLISSYPYAIPNEQNLLPAIIWSSHAGAHLGDAAAGALSGRVNPAGRLPMTWYRSEHDLPDINEYDIETAQTTYQYFKGKPLYPFGFGLSYAEFQYQNLRVGRDENGRLTAKVTVANISECDGDEVVQVYVSCPDSAVRRPQRKLCGFERVHLRAGQRKIVFVTIPQYTLEIFDTHSRRMLLESGSYHFSAGGSSADLPLECSYQIEGETVPLRPEKFDAEMYDSAENMRIGWCRTLRRHVLYAKGWGGSAVYEGVPLAGKRTLTFYAASVLHETKMTVRISRFSSEIALAPSLRYDDFAAYTLELPENLPESGRLELSVQEGVSLLELELR